MSYTEEDILDLFADLHSVGLAETPEEEADRHRKESKKGLVYSPAMKSPSLISLEYFVNSSIPHTYLLLVRVNPIASRQTTTIYPVVRGQVVTLSHCLPVEEYLDQVQSRMNHISQHQNLQDLKACLLELQKTYTEISVTKYSFLNDI
jgi:hypothetical protein